MIVVRRRIVTLAEVRSPRRRFQVMMRCGHTANLATWPSVGIMRCGTCELDLQGYIVLGKMTELQARYLLDRVSAMPIPLSERGTFHDKAP